MAPLVYLVVIAMSSWPLAAARGEQLLYRHHLARFGSSFITQDGEINSIERQISYYRANLLAETISVNG